MGIFDISNNDFFMPPMQRKPKWTKKSGLPKFEVQGNWVGGDTGPKKVWKNTGMSFTIANKDNKNYNIKSKQAPVINMGQLNIGPSNKGIQIGDAYIMEDTLFKENKHGYTGMDTLYGMAEQVKAPDKYGWVETVQGTNYANIDYMTTKEQLEAGYSTKKTRAHKAKEALKKLEEKDIFLPSYVNVDNTNYYTRAVGSRDDPPPPPPDEDEDEKSDWKDQLNPDGSSKGASTSHPNAVGGHYAVAGSGITTAKGARRSRRIRNQAEAFKRDPYVATAHAIQDKLGRSRMKATWNKFGYGNRVRMVDYKKQALGIINDYNEKSSLVEWAKTIDPEHARVDPNKTMSVIASTKMVTKRRKRQKNVSWWWVHYQVPEHTYKTVNRKDTMNKGDTMDWIYNKVMRKSKDNKSQFGKYFSTDPEIADHNYYTISDDDFKSYEEYKQDVLGEISSRRSNQEQIIERIGTDTDTVEQKDRTNLLIPDLETVKGNLDEKATVLKKEVGDHDWQKTISQETFGTDTIHGESHIGGVLQSYDGQVRGGAYYVQDAGKLITETKKYESELESQIKQVESDESSINVDDTEGLVDYFNDKSEKEYAIASKTYLTKSLDLTQKEREELEYARRAQGMGSSAPAKQYKQQKKRGGKPSIKTKSKPQYTNTRTRGGQNNLGGLVI